MSKFIKNIRKRVRSKVASQGLFLALGLISIIGFTLAVIVEITGKIITLGYPIMAAILGFGLMAESRFKFLRGSKGVDSVNSLITFAVGAGVVITGALVFIFGVTTSLIGFVIGTNILAIFVLLWQMLIVK